MRCTVSRLDPFLRFSIVLALEKRRNGLEKGWIRDEQADLFPGFRVTL